MAALSPTVENHRCAECRPVARSASLGLAGASWGERDLEPKPATMRRMSPLTLRHATPDDLDALAPLFDAYRRFYEQPGDIALASEFLHDRMERRESAILVAQADGELLGFCQMYPSWCSVAAARIFVLYDLF